MKAPRPMNSSGLEQAHSTLPPCPLWKKILAGVLVVIAVTLALMGTAWFDHLSFSWASMLEGVLLTVAYSIALVLAGILLVTALLWLLSQSPRMVRRGQSAITFVAHCYPQQIKNRILHQ